MDFEGDNELVDIVVSHTGQAYFVLYPDRRQQGLYMTGPRLSHLLKRGQIALSSHLTLA